MVSIKFLLSKCLITLDFNQKGNCSLSIITHKLFILQFEEKDVKVFVSGLLKMNHTLESNKVFNQMGRTEDNYFKMVVKEISHGVIQ